MRSPAGTQDLQAAIGRAIVDRNDLVRPLPVDRFCDLIEKDGDVFFLVVDRKNDGEVGVGRHQRGSVTPKAFSKFEVVRSATSATGTPHNVASSSATLMTYAASLSRPRNGTGARNGVSVSISTRSCGNPFAQARTQSALRSVTMPGKEI